MQPGMQRIQVEIIKPALHKRILSSPFKYYGKMMGFTFCGVSVTNIFTALFDRDRRQALIEHPDIFSGSLFMKSTYYAILWPAFYITALTSPKNAFIMWGGVENAFGTNNY